ncbi:MAG: DUF1653 domain-containing protein [Rickettsiales bacterium]|nr:DUF1653 domain-containing protein [Rickettsiales bacterium]
MIVYQALYGEYSVWCCPASVWNELAVGKPRFEKIVNAAFPTLRAT